MSGTGLTGSKLTGSDSDGPDPMGSAGVPRVLDSIVAAITGINFPDIPEPAVRTAVDGLTDALGVGIAGSREALATRLIRGLDIANVPGPAPLIGLPLATIASVAALFNGAVVHALDFDDTNHPAYAHPSSHLLPILLTDVGVGGADAVCAYVLGLEVEARLGRTLNMSHYLAGWHTTGTFGTFAATVAAAKLMRLDAAQARTAVAIGASMASGLRSNFGTMTKPLHAGLAAQNGVQAAALARAGFTASGNAVDGDFGFLQTFRGYADDAGPDTACWATLGTEWETISPYGLAIKPYPSCGATHPAIEAALTVREQVGAARIESVTVKTTRHSSRILIHNSPQTALEGKFSMQFCVAAALLYGQIGLRTFDDGIVRDPRVRQLMSRVKVGVHPELVDNTEFAAEVQVTTESGQQASSRIELAKGKRERWLTTSDLETKFAECAEPSVGAAKSRQAFELMQSIAELPDLRRLESVIH